MIQTFHPRDLYVELKLLNVELKLLNIELDRNSDPAVFLNDWSNQKKPHICARIGRIRRNPTFVLFTGQIRRNPTFVLFTGQIRRNPTFVLELVKSEETPHLCLFNNSSQPLGFSGKQAHTHTHTYTHTYADKITWHLRSLLLHTFTTPHKSR